VTDVDRQALAGEQVDHRQSAESSPVGELVSDEVHAPDLVAGSLVTAAHLAISLPAQDAVPPREPEPARQGIESIALRELERKAIIDALQRTHGNKGRAARLPMQQWVHFIERHPAVKKAAAPKAAAKKPAAKKASKV
jgi:DNA-binding NtrC family response regulator